MFSPRIIERKQAKLESTLRISLTRYDPGDVQDRVEYLKTLVVADDKDNKLTRPLRPAELEFINNENLLCSIDFRYWAERYGTLKLSGGGVGHLKPWASQEIVLSRCSKIEEREWDKKDRNEPFSGIRMLWHKARQMGETALARLIIQHGLYFNQHIGALSASIGQGEIGELYDRDSLIYDNLPWWMKPERLYDVKNESMQFGKLNTRIEYQESKQKSGLGIGRQFELSHLTECAAWENSAIIELDYFPTIPIVNRTDSAYKRGPRVIAILESTAQGRGNWWHEFTEATRVGDHPEWDYIFVPWYAEPGRYRLTPPPSWRPNDVTIAHAKRVEETSAQWMGHTVRLEMEQLYFYERSYESARKANTLNFFLTNYPCVVGETRVSTETGIIPICDAQDTRRVESGLVSAWADNGEKEVYTLETNNGRRLTATANHHIFLHDGSCLPLSDMAIGQEIALVAPRLPDSLCMVAWNPIASQTNSVIINEDWGRFLGYYMGDGSFHEDTVDVACDAKDQDVIEDVARLMTLLIGRPPGKSLHRSGGCMRVRLSSIHWKPLLNALGAIRRYDGPKGGVTRKVCVPKCIFSSPIRVVREFLSALFEADGHAYKYWARTSLSASSRQFLEDVQLLLLCFGLNSKLTRDDNLSCRSGGEKKYQAHKLSLGAAASDIFHREIGFVSNRKRSACVGVAGVLGRKPDGRRRPNRMIDVVKSIIASGTARVYDLTVDETHRYGANGILVHNCEPEEGFQHSTAGAFDFDSLDRFQRMCKEPAYYEFVRDAKGKLQRSALEPADLNLNDLRGVLCVWESPKASETYVVGADPAGGIMNWDRRVRVAVDRDTDNAVCSVIRVGRRGRPDVQVAEYAAPLIIPDFSPICDYLGRWYAGADEAEAALLIPETHGVNTTIIPELLQRFQYPNVYVWKYLDGASPKRSNHYGWQPTQESNKALFLKALDWLGKGRIEVRSSALVEEFRDCTSDWITASLRAKWGRHDDRVRALFLAIWAAHDWSTFADYENWEAERVEAKPRKPWAMDVSTEAMEQEISDQFSDWLD